MVPYGYSPFLQSFGGDLINRTDFSSAEGVLNGDAAVKWGEWFQGLAKDGMISKKSSADPTADFIYARLMRSEERYATGYSRPALKRCTPSSPAPFATTRATCLRRCSLSACAACTP